MKELTFTYPNMTAKVFVPTLTEEERSKRMKEVERAAMMLLKKKMR